MTTQQLNLFEQPQKEKKPDPERLPDDQVVVKLAHCQHCDGIITAAVKHMMDRKSRNHFAKEAMDFNMRVSEQPLLEYREQKPRWCDCKKESK